LEGSGLQGRIKDLEEERPLKVTKRFWVGGESDKGGGEYSRYFFGKGEGRRSGLGTMEGT